VITERLSNLQGLYAERGRKYEKAKTIIRTKKTTVRAGNAGGGLIKKPAGRRSRDFNILEMMRDGDGDKRKVEISKDTYKNLICFLHNTVKSSNIDMNLSFSKQDKVEVVKVTAIMKTEYPFLKEYGNNTWPVEMLMGQYLNNHRANLRAKANKAAAARDTTPAGTGNSTAGPSVGPSGPDGNDADNDDGDRQDGGQSDVSVSDIDSN